jgi:ribonucleoside-diphosphate reductase alpha chain
VTVNHVAGRPFEVFLRHADPTLTEWTDALGRMLTGVFRREGDVRFVAEQLQQVGSTKGGAFLSGKYWPSQVAAIGGALALEILTIGQGDAEASREPPPVTGEACPKCRQSALANEEGCLRCLTCGYSACG